MNAKEKHWLSRIASLPCVLCRKLGRHTVGVHVHHVREGQGMGQRAQNFLSIPLCPECHEGRHGIHGDRMLFRQAKCDEMDLLSDTIEQMTN